MAVKRKQIYNSTQGLKCGNYKCHNEATGMPDDIEDTLTRIEKDARLRRAAEAVLCAVHIGAEKRRKWGTPETFVAITDTVRNLALAFHKEREDAIEADRVRQQRENEARARAGSERQWQELADEPDYTVVYEEESRWNAKHPERKFTIYTSDVVAHSKEHDRPLNSYSSVADILIKDSDPDASIINPAYVSLQVSSAGTAKFTRVLTEALRKAAEMVDATNARLIEARKG